MSSLYIKLYSSENQPKDELNKNLKDFDTIGDSMTGFFFLNLCFIHKYLRLIIIPNPLRTVINCHTLANPNKSFMLFRALRKCYIEHYSKHFLTLDGC